METGYSGVCFGLRAVYVVMYPFFSPSRRRHTRCGRDWSSDVCSSDLHPTTPKWPRNAWRRWKKPRMLEGLGHEVEYARPDFDGMALARCYLSLYFGEVSVLMEIGRASCRGGVGSAGVGVHGRRYYDCT